jgi:hypothetical protein
VEHRTILLATSPQKIIQQALENLNSTQRQVFFNLSYVGAPSSPNEGDIALAIVETNAVGTGERRCGVFPRMARLNHGCGRSFNTVYSWREEESVLFVHALKPIKEGEVGRVKTSQYSVNTIFPRNY